MILLLPLSCWSTASTAGQSTGDSALRTLSIERVGRLLTSCSLCLLVSREAPPILPHRNPVSVAGGARERGPERRAAGGGSQVCVHVCFGGVARPGAEGLN